MSAETDFRKALHHIEKAHTLVTKHLDTGVTHFILQDFHSLLLTLDLLAKAAALAPPPKPGGNGPDPPG